MYKNGTLVVITSELSGFKWYCKFDNEGQRIECHYPCKYRETAVRLFIKEVLCNSTEKLIIVFN